MLDPKKEFNSKKNGLKILKFFLIYILWSNIYIFIIYSYHDINLSLSIFLSKILSGFYHFWYIGVIIVLLLITPLLRQITKKADRKILKYANLLFFIGCLSYTINALDILPFHKHLVLIINIIPFSKFATYIGYYLLGYYLHNYPLKKKQRLVSYMLGFLGIISCILLTKYYSIQQGIPVSTFYDYFSLTTLLPAVAIFAFFAQLKTENLNNKLKSIILFVSKRTLGIYIVHALVIEFYNLNNSLTTLNSNLIYAIPMLVVFVFVISLVVSILLGKIPILKKWLI